MRRLNVQFSQIEECIRTSMFAVDMLPVNPPLRRGEELLLQLVKADATSLNKVDSRIEFALIFERAVPDTTGAISREHWPNAGKTWKYVLYCSETIPTIPFSLERLGLNKDYGGQTNPIYIESSDETRIRPYLKGGVQPDRLSEVASVHELLSAIRNYDRVVQLAPVQTTRVREHERRLGDPWLTDTLKLYYEHRCQICLHDFKPRYGVPFADTLFLRTGDRSDAPVSRNILVVCPNHSAIIAVARPEFDLRALAFRFSNGLVEKVMLRDHLLN
jgi:hypothetical protein